MELFGIKFNIIKNILLLHNLIYRRRLMLKNLLAISTVAVIATIFTGCAVKTGNAKLEHMQRNNLQQTIVKGQTTQDGVKSIFGEPQSTDFLPDGRQKWRYVFVEKSEKGVNYVPVVNWFTRGTNDLTKTLVVLFNKNGKVDDYIFSTSKGETNSGAFN